MGRAAESGSNVPTWLLGSQQLEARLDRLKGALAGPPSFTAGLDASALAHNNEQIRESVSLVGDAARAVEVGVRQAFAEYRGLSVDPAHERRLTELVNELTLALERARHHGARDAAVARPAPAARDLEREHPRCHPAGEPRERALGRAALAPRSARSVGDGSYRPPVPGGALLPSRSAGGTPSVKGWRSAASPCGVRSSSATTSSRTRTTNRVDLVVSGPGFVIGIENKVWALGVEYPLAHRDERANTVRFVQRALTSDIEPRRELQRREGDPGVPGRGGLGAGGSGGSGCVAGGGGGGGVSVSCSCSGVRRGWSA